MKQPLVFNQFSGGLGTDGKIGLKNSFAGQIVPGSLGTFGVDFRKNPSQFSVLPAAVREDGGVVKDLIQNEVMTKDGVIYAVGSGGTIYKRTTAGVWSSEATIGVGTFGLDYRRDTDSIYASTNKAVSLYNQISVSPAMYMGYYGQSYSQYDNSSTVGFNVNSYQVGSTFTYTPPTAIVESQVNERFFQTDIEPLVKISIFVVAKGSGNWTLTLHDGLNNVLGTSTITNASLTNNTFNDFSFTTATNGQVRAYVAPNARTYHIHVTSTVADGTLSTSATGDLSACDLKVWADRLVMTSNGLHPIERFLQYELIGNGNYVSTWEPINLGIDPSTMTSGPAQEWLQHKLVFPMEYEVCGIASTNEFAAIALGKFSSANNSIPQEGLIAYWDGTSETYNYYFKVPEGTPYGLHEHKNAVYYQAGGDWWAVTPPSTTPVKVRNMPGTDTEFSGSPAPITIYPYSATVRRGIHMTAFPCMTTNTAINFGVYSFGGVDKNLPDSFGYSYIVSTGSTNYSPSNNLTIGMVKSFGDSMHVSWRDDSNPTGSYGIDVISNSSPPAVNSSWESLIFDNGLVMKHKKAIRIFANFLTLPTDCSFRLKYKLDRATTWSFSGVFNSTNIQPGNIAWMGITGQNLYYEGQIGIDIISGPSAPPIFTSLTLIYDDLRGEGLPGG